MESTRNVLQKMYLRNCWNAMLCNILARYGHIRCLQWVVSMDCPWNVNECCIEADRSGYMNIVQWITTTCSTWSHPGIDTASQPDYL